MEAHVLCVDNNGPRLMRHQKSLENAGCVILNTCDETQAVNLLKSHPVDVVCVQSGFVDGGGNGWNGVGTNLERVKPDVPIVLIRDNGAIPSSFEEQVDVVIEEADFDARARWLLVQLQDVQYPFFLRWLNDWKGRASEPRNDEPLRIC